MRSLLLVPLLLASSAGHGGRAPIGTSDPEVAFLRQLKSGSRELYVADENGSGARLLTTGRNFTFVSAGPKPSRAIVVQDGSSIRLIKYGVSGDGAVVESNSLLPVSGTVFDISPSGTLVAFYSSVDAAYKTYRLSDGAISNVYPLKAGTIGGGVTRFSADGAALLIVERVRESGIAEIIRAPLDGSAASGTSIVDAKLSNFTQANNGSILVTISNPSSAPDMLIRRYDPGDTIGSYVTKGNVPSLSCDESSLLFQRSNTDGSVALLRKDLASGTEQIIASPGHSPSSFTPC